MQLGMADGLSSYSMTAKQVADHGINGSMTYCAELGRYLQQIQNGKAGAYAEFLEFAKAKIFFSGKIIDLDRRTTGGFARGTLLIEDFKDPDRRMRLDFQNEFLIAYDGDEAVVTTPDLICVLDHENAQPITVEGLNFGQRVNVVGLPCAPEWHQPGMLELVGPRAFGYDTDYRSIEGRDA
jgi:DUF917 family protein